MYEATEIIQELDSLQQEELELRRAYMRNCEQIAKKRQDLLSELELSCLQGASIGALASSRNREHSETSKLCDRCPEREDCQEPCQAVERGLSGPYSGKLHNESTIDLDWGLLGEGNTPDDSGDGDDENRNVKADHSMLKNLKKVQTLGILGQYHQCGDIISKKQLEVLTLYYGEDKSVREIAKELKKSMSTVSELLKRARASKRRHDFERRKEYFDLVRNSQD